MAKDIFDKTIFDGYRVESLTESAQDIIPKYNNSCVNSSL